MNDSVKEVDTWNSVVVNYMDLSTLKGKVMRIVHVPTVMTQQKQGYPSDGLGRDGLDPVMNDNSMIPVNGEESGSANLSLSWSDNSMGAASCEGRVGVKTVSDLSLNAP